MSDRVDVINKMEELTGEHWSEFTDEENMSTLFMQQLENMRVEQEMKKANDTYWGVGWYEFKSLLTDNGFKCGMEYDFVDGLYDDTHTEEFITYYNVDNGCIVCATSYGNKGRINGGYAYIEVEYDKNKGYLPNGIMHTGDCYNFKEVEDGSTNIRKYGIRNDVREGLFGWIKRCETKCTPKKVWEEKDKFMWLLDYMERNVNDYDYRKISKEKYEKLPDECKNIMKSAFIER